jgi:hypothetical protein
MMLTVHPAAVNGDRVQACPSVAQALHDGLGNFICPPGKEIVMRLLIVLCTLAVFATALVGCKAEGEIGDTQTSVNPAR